MGPPRLRSLATALVAELRDRRATGHLCISTLATRAALSQPMLSLILNGHRRLTIDTADALMLALEITTEDLLEIALDQNGAVPPPPAAPTSYGRHLGRGPVMHVHRD